jgi:hypothetical protein
MRAGTDVWARFAAAQDELDIALGTLDATAILQAAADLHAAAADLARPGSAQDGEAVAAALNGALKRIETCRLRVMFLADHGAQRVASLTRAGAAADRWRPDRAA